MPYLFCFLQFSCKFSLFCLSQFSRYIFAPFLHPSNPDHNQNHNYCTNSVDCSSNFRKPFTHTSSLQSTEYSQSFSLSSGPYVFRGTLHVSLYFLSPPPPQPCKTFAGRPVPHSATAATRVNLKSADIAAAAMAPDDDSWIKHVVEWWGLGRQHNH